MEAQVIETDKDDTYEKLNPRGFVGFLFQIKLLLLFYLRTLNKRLVSKLATEMVKAEKLDDIVFSYTRKGIEKHNFYQVKHIQRLLKYKDVVKHYEKNEKNTDFCLEKYYLAYLKLKEKFVEKNIEEMGIITIAELGEGFEDFPDEEEDQEGILKGFRFLRFTPSQTKLTEGPDTDNFLRKFKLYHSFPTEGYLDVIVKEELSKYVLHEFKVDQTFIGLVTDSILQQFVKWFKESEGTFVRDSDWLDEVQRNIFTLIVGQLSRCYAAGIQGDIQFRDPIPEMGEFLQGEENVCVVTVADGTEMAAARLEKEIPERLVVVRRKWLENRSLSEALEGSAGERSAIAIDCEPFGPPGPTLADFKTILIVRTQNSEALRSCLGDRSHRIIELDPTEIIFPPDTLSEIKGKYAMFQGERVRVGEILDDEMLKKVKSDVDWLSRAIAGEEISFGARISLPVHFGSRYIERKFEFKRYLKPEVLSSGEEVGTLGVEGATRAEVESWRGRQGRRVSLPEDPWQPRGLLLLPEGAMLTDLGPPPAHLLRASRGRLAWAATEGDVTLIKPFIDDSQKDTFDEAAMLDSRERIVLLSDDAGMGKSTFLINFASKLKRHFPDHWVVRLDLGEYTGFLKTKRTPVDSNAAKTFLNELLSLSPSTFTCEFDTYLFRKSVRKGKVIILLDSVDEISPTYTEWVISFVEKLRQTEVKQMWIATRPYTREGLERALGVLSQRLVPLGVDEQEEFLSRRWGRPRAAALLAALTAAPGGPLRSFCQVPLHLDMLAEIFDGKDDYEMGKSLRSMNILDVYKKFIDKKIMIVIRDKNKIDDTIVGNEAYVLKTVLKIWNNHQYLSIREIFGNEVLEKWFSPGEKIDLDYRTGIITVGPEGDVAFLHRTFGEYLCAFTVIQKLKQPQSKNYSSFVQFVLDTIFVMGEYDVVTEFIDGYFESSVEEVPEVFSKQAVEKIKTYERKPLFCFSIVAKGHTGILNFVIKALKKSEEGVKILYRTEDTGGRNLLTIAAENGKSRTVEALLAETWDPNREDGRGRRALVEAAGGGHSAVVLCLLGAGAALDAPDREGRTALLAALTAPREADTVIGQLIEAGARPGPAELGLAAAEGSLRILHLLLEAADISSLGPALLRAVAADRTDSVRILLDAGAPIRARVRSLPSTRWQKRISLLFYSRLSDDDSATALHLACRAGGRDTVRLLLERVVRIDDADKYGRTALHEAAKRGRAWAVRMLLENGANKEARDAWGGTPLHAACHGPDVDTVRCLLENEASVNAKDAKDRTPLHLAAKWGRCEAITELLEHGAEPRAKDEFGQIPLHLAALWGRVEATRALVRRGAVGAVDLGGRTPLHLAALAGRCGPPSLFLPRNDTPNHVPYIEVCRCLLDRGADLDTRDSTEHTPLLLAVGSQPVHDFLRARI